MKKITRYLCIAVTMVTAAGLAQAEGRWLAPTNGWDHNYMAIAGSGAGKGVPTQYSTLWKTGGYQSANPNGAGYVAIIPDPVEGDVLMMVHTNAPPYYSMTSAPGAGTTNDLITLDCRFRLADDSQSDEQPQLMLSVARPRLSGAPIGWNQWTVLISKQILKLNSTTISVPLGTNWHNLRLIIDVARDISSVYLDSNPLRFNISPSGVYTTTSRNWTAFGDSGSTVNGQAHVKYLRWTNTELVHPAAWQHAGDVDPLTEGFAYKPGNLEYAASNNLLPEDTSPNWTKSFPDGAAWMTNDEVTGETALHLDMDTNSTGYTYSSYSQAKEAGRFVTNDLVVADFRFRLVDDSQADDQHQLMLGMAGPRPDGIGGQQFFYCRFAKDHIHYFNNGATVTFLTTLSTNWHNVNWRMNWNTRDAEMYLDDNPVKIFSHQSRLYTTSTNNNTIFGDGSASIEGVARVSLLRVTRQTPTWQGGVEEDGTPYWQGDDGDGSYGYYEAAVPAEVMNHAQGWTASCKLRLLQTSQDSFGVTMRCFDQANKWGMVLKTDAFYHQSADGGFVRLGSNSRPAQYHTFQMYYDPVGDDGNGTVSYYRNGWLVQTLTRAESFTNGLSKNLFQWGCDSLPSATSTVRWNLVEFTPGNQVIAQIPYDGTLLLVQ